MVKYKSQNWEKLWTPTMKNWCEVSRWNLTRGGVLTYPPTFIYIHKAQNNGQEERANLSLDLRW